MLLPIWTWWSFLTSLAVCQQLPTDFLAVGGGSERANTEIALEKNIRYFQRTLKTLDYNPSKMTYLFADGKDGKESVRYLDAQGVERFKKADIPFLTGRADWSNIQAWLTTKGKKPNPLFFYFTGHGLRNQANLDNNSFTVWQEPSVNVQQLAQQLDNMPARPPVVVMMAQCYGGSFGNIIYRGGIPSQAIAEQERCGFFGTIKTRTSVGCTPAVDEADYRDYSSSFFAGLSGKDRLGRTVPSADFNQDGRVSYAEAHAFAKVDNLTTDVPISTSEMWLQRQATAQIRNQVQQRPLNEWLSLARPSQKYVLTGLVRLLRWDMDLSLGQNRRNNSRLSDRELAWAMRLEMELTNIAVARETKQRKILERLLKCEERSP